MSTILYYSNFCQHSKKLLQQFGKSPQKDVHFICIDKRVKDKNGKIFISLENGQQIVMPENVTKVPALLLLSDNYKVLYGESILQYFRPRQQAAVMQATQNNIEPMAFSFGGGGGGGGGSAFGIMSDHYSFLDMDPDSLSAKGNGGMRQMHNYADLNHVAQFRSIADDGSGAGEGKIPQGMTIEQLQQQREKDLNFQQGGPKF
jgi:hypothetical protein